MVNTLVQRQLRERATKEANRIVAATIRRHDTATSSAPPVVPVSATTGKPKRMRDRGSLRHQYAPKDSWLSLGRAAAGQKAATGQLLLALNIAEKALAAGPADRATLTKLMADANKGWTNVTASGCISRLVAAGRLVVVSPPRNH